MKLTSSTHNHTTLSDGASTPEEMAQAALAAGFTDLGISDHSDPGNCGIRSETEYIRTMRALQKEYAGRLRIAVALEQDYYAPVQNRAALDYIVGSVHYLRGGAGEYYPVDGSSKKLAECIQKLFGGDAMAMVRAYYTLVAEHVRRDRPEIVGHFDLIRKNNCDGRFFDEDSPEYRDIAQNALEACLQTGAIFEINTGGMARGYCSEPYPARFLLEILHQKGARVTLNADAHHAKNLCYAFDEMLALLCDIGFSSVTVLENGHFVDKPL